MKILLKQAIINKYNIIAFIFVPVVSFLAWAIHDHGNLFRALAKGSGLHGEPLTEYFNIIYGFFGYTVWGFSYMQLMLPLLASFIMLPYLREKRMYSYSYIREKSYSGAVLKPMLRQLLIGCTVLFLGYMVFLVSGLVWKINPMDTIYYSIDTGEPHCTRVFMPEIFGEFFAAKNMFLFFTVDGFWKFFVFCFVYGLFSVSVSFYTRKDFMCLIVPTVYYIVLDLILSGSGHSLYAPSYPIMSNSYAWISIPQLILPLLPPLLFAAFTFVREFAVKKKRRDAYAV